MKVRYDFIRLSGLLIRWRFDEGAGREFTDLAGPEAPEGYPRHGDQRTGAEALYRRTGVGAQRAFGRKLSSDASGDSIPRAHLQTE